MNGVTTSSIASSPENVQQQQHQQQPPSTSRPDSTTTALTLQQDPWQICLSTRVLGSFLRGTDLCRLSICAHNFLPFRTQIQHLSSRYLTPGVLGHMAAGGLLNLATLEVGWSSPMLANKLGPAFRALPHLEHLSVSCWSVLLPIIATILNSLVKARLKTLFLNYVGGGVGLGDESVFADAFQGFHNLQDLNFDCFRNRALVPYAVAQMERGEFPCLSTLRIRDCVLLEGDACKIFKAICHGHLPCLKSLDLSDNQLGVVVIDDAVQAMPHLNVLNLRGSYMRGGHDRLQAAAAEFMDLNLKL